MVSSVLCALTFQTSAYAAAARRESWGSVRFWGADLLTLAALARQATVRRQTRGSRELPGRCEFRRQRGGRSKVHLVRRLAREGRMWHLGIVLIDVAVPTREARWALNFRIATADS